MTKEKYIEQELFKLAESSLLALSPYGTFFIVLLSILDYFVTPENFTKFILNRNRKMTEIKDIIRFDNIPII